MDPRTKPTWTGVLEEVITETKKYGGTQLYKPGVAQCGVYWKEVKALGLPTTLKIDQRVTTIDEEGRLDWKLYVATIEGIRLCFAESADGATLYLLLLVPANVMTLRETIAAGRARL
jgi:hypothetical protein